MTFDDAVGVLVTIGCLGSYGLGYAMGWSRQRRQDRRRGIYHHKGDMLILEDGSLGRVERM